MHTRKEREREKYTYRAYNHMRLPKVEIGDRDRRDRSPRRRLGRARAVAGTARRGARATRGPGGGGCAAAWDASARCSRRCVRVTCMCMCMLCVRIYIYVHI